MLHKVRLDTELYYVRGLDKLRAESKLKMKYLIILSYICAIFSNNQTLYAENTQDF